MRPLRRLLSTCLAPAFGVLALAGCVTTTAPATAPAARVAMPAAPDGLPAPSDESRRLASFYARVQQSLVAQGLLRTDLGGTDAPYTAAQLAENFRRIALFEEYANIGISTASSQRASTLHRWQDAIRVKLEFGGAIPQDRRAHDRRAVETFVRRLSRVTGHPMSMAKGNANFHVFIVDEDARRTLGPQLKRIIPAIGPGVLRTVLDLPRSFYCVVLSSDPRDDGVYSTSVAIIRAELPELMRRSCIHEEIAQGLGLSNDSPAARPSIFNDDEEFALLTRHDEQLLRILYNPRLRPGMTADQALPIVRELAQALAGGPS